MKNATGSELPRLGLGTADRLLFCRKINGYCKRKKVLEKKEVETKCFKRIPGTDLLGASKISGYTVIVPENYRTFGQILETGKRDELKKNVQNTLEGMKKFFNEYDEKKMLQKLKDASPDTLRKMMRVIPKVVSLEDDFLNAYGFPLTAGLDSNIGVRPVEEEKNFIQRNPLTTAAGTTAAAATTKTGRNILGRTIGGGLGPTGVAGLTVAGGGYDLSSPLDRFILGTEAAFAPELVKGTIGATKGMKNRALQKVVQRALNLGMSVPTALKVARIASPLGLATLAGEGIYQVGKLGFEDQKRFDALTPEQQAAERAEQEAFAFDVQGAKDGGRMGFKVGSLRKGIQALIDKSVKSIPKDTTPDLDALIKKALDEDFFDKKDRIIDNINAKIARARAKGLDSKEIGEGQIEFYDDITKSNFRTKTGPFFDRRKKAGGGILKQAGDSSGPPPESGPNSQGLQGLLNRGKKI